MTNDDPERRALGQRFAAARKAAGLTGDDVGQALDYKAARKTISQWETGRSFPDAMVLRRLCRLYKVSADQLLWDLMSEDHPSEPALNHALMRRLAMLTTEQRGKLEESLSISLDMLGVPAVVPIAASGKPLLAA